MLSRLALLNTVAMLMNQIIVMAISFFLTPVLVSSLGVASFGVWQLLIKWSAYIGFLDGRSHENLKWEVSRNESISDDEKRKSVGASVFVWLTYLPLLVMASLIFVYYINSSVQSTELPIEHIVFSAVLMCVNAFLCSVRSFPEAIIRGSNKGYKQVFARIIIIIFSGAMSYYVVIAGYGLVGLSVVQIATTLLLLLSFFWVARKNISWLGFKRPDANVFKQSQKRSFWFFVWSIVNFGMMSIEVLLLGMFRDADTVGQFVIIFYAIQMVTVIISIVISAILPGIGSLIGSNNYVRASEIRTESLLYSWWLALSLTVTIILVNGSFISLWIGEGIYAGHLDNLFVILMAFQLVFIKNDSLIINLALEQKEKVKYTVVSLAVIVIIGYLLIPVYGILGACVACITGRVMLQYYYPRIINNFFGVVVADNYKFVVAKRVTFTFVLCLLSFCLNEYVYADNWLDLIFLSFFIFTMVFCFLFMFAFSSEERKCVSDRFHVFTRMRVKS